MALSLDILTWQIRIQNILSKMVLELPQPSQVKINIGDTFLEVRIETSTSPAEKNAGDWEEEASAAV